jgi:hypothetical protein
MHGLVAHNQKHKKNYRKPCKLYIPNKTDNTSKRVYAYCSSSFNLHT